MTPKEALNIIEQALGQVQANRETHKVLEKALGVLGSIVLQPKSHAELENERHLSLYDSLEAS